MKKWPLFFAIYFCICLLEHIKSLQLFTDAQTRISKVLLNGNEGLSLVDRSFDFLCLFGHISYFLCFDVICLSSNNIQDYYAYSPKCRLQR